MCAWNMIGHPFGARPSFRGEVAVSFRRVKSTLFEANKATKWMLAKTSDYSVWANYNDVHRGLHRGPW